MSTAAPVRRGVARQRVAGAHWIFIAPAAILFLIFFAWPLVSSLVLSFQDRVRGESTWVGLAQYERLLNDPLVWTSLLNVGLLLVVQVPIMLVIGIVVAAVLNQSWLAFRAGFRTIYFLPTVTILVAYALVFRVMLSTDTGVLNQLLGMLHLGPIDWLNDPFWAKVALIAAIVWRWTGFNVVILLAGLQGVGAEQYEAAQIDGAGTIRNYVSVVIPQLKPVILFVTITSVIGTLQLFDESLVLTGGGPSNATLTPIMYLYRVGFQQLHFEYASAIAWLVVVVIGVLSIIQWRFMGDRER